MFDFIENKVFGKTKGGDENKKDGASSALPFSFSRHDDVEPYQYPNLYDEANEMCQVSTLIYRYEENAIREINAR